MSRITTCPHCSTRIDVPEGITARTTICPHCLTDVDNPHPGFQIQPTNINTDVKRDMSAGSIGVVVLVGFVVLGIAQVIGNSSGTPLLGYSCVALFIIVCIAIIRWWSRRTGSVLGGIFLVLGTITAIYIFAVIACWDYKVVSH